MSSVSSIVKDYPLFNTTWASLPQSVGFKSLQHLFFGRLLAAEEVTGFGEDEWVEWYKDLLRIGARSQQRNTMSL